MSTNGNVNGTESEGDIVERLFRAGAVVLPTARSGWDRSIIDCQSREYILDREACIEALRRLGRIPWQSVNCENKSLALAILDNVKHALSVMKDEMAKNEGKML